MACFEWFFKSFEYEYKLYACKYCEYIGDLFLLDIDFMRQWSLNDDCTVWLVTKVRFIHGM